MRMCEAVVHAFQKKSTHGIATPKHEIDVVRERIKRLDRLMTIFDRLNREVRVSVSVMPRQQIAQSHVPA